MNNSIDVYVNFSFKGKNYSPSITLDLNVINNVVAFNGLHLNIARANNIDTYSYLFDAMESTPLIFANPKGLAVQFTQDNDFDYLQFMEASRQQKILQLISDVAKKEMNISNIEQQEGLKNTLISIYQLAYDEGLSQ